MKMSLFCLAVWAFSVGVNAQEITQVVISADSVQIEIPCLTIATPEGEKFYRVVLNSQEAETELKFNVDWEAVRELENCNNQLTPEVMVSDQEVILSMPYFLLQTTTATAAYKVDLTSLQEQQELTFSVDWASLQEQTLSIDEIEGLLYMREEEKLARDVYTTMHEIWGDKVFESISSSEQTHMDSILDLLTKYHITDPVNDNSIGIFKNVFLQDLYDELIADGIGSLVDALLVGAAIEEIDIMDIQLYIDRVDNKEDIIIVYGNLMKGSTNHLRAYVNNLAKQGVTYTPQFLDQEIYAAIIANVQ